MGVKSKLKVNSPSFAYPFEDLFGGRVIYSEIDGFDSQQMFISLKV